MLPSSKKKEQVVGGTSLDKTCVREDYTYIGGTEGGSVAKYSIKPPTEQEMAAFIEDNNKVRWKVEAIEVLSNLPVKSVNEVKRRVERYVQDKGERDIWAPSVFGAKPEMKLIFPPAGNITYERHFGPVTGISCSPFQRRLFLTCSSDGSIRMYDVLGNRPVAMFEPGVAEYIMSVLWSPFRPAVFVAVASSGSVYIYDLLESKQTPSYVLPHTQSKFALDEISHDKTCYSLAFNPRQRDFLAVGYHDGSARIIQLNHNLSNQKRDEIAVLQSYLDQKSSE